MSQEEQNQANEDSNAPHRLTSMQWDMAERAIDKLEAIPRAAAAALGPKRAPFVGFVGLITMIVLASALIVKPISTMPFGAPKIHTVETAKHYVPGSKLGKLGSTKRAGYGKYLLVYVTGYFVPYFFSAKLKSPDLVMLLLRSIVFGLLMLLTIQMVFLREEDEPEAATE